MNLIDFKKVGFFKRSETKHLKIEGLASEQTLILAMRPMFPSALLLVAAPRAVAFLLRLQALANQADNNAFYREALWL